MIRKQSAPSAATLTTIYTVPASTETVASSINICNRGAKTTYRIAVRPLGAAISNEMYIVYDKEIAANDVHSFVIGVTLIATDVVSVYNTLATVSFNMFGEEVAI